MKIFYVDVKKSFLNHLGKDEIIIRQNSKERTAYLNECAMNSLKNIDFEIETIGLEARRNRLDSLRFEASSYSGKQEAAEAVEVRMRGNDLYNVFI